MKPKDSAERILNVAVIVAGSLVLIAWLVCLTVALREAWYKDKEAIAASGQIGDTFGAVNALFTGFALIGLVYTALLQRQEIQGQEQDSQENKLALQREARAQYLTARLNATVALLQACEASVSLDDAQSAPKAAGPFPIRYPSYRSHQAKVLEVSKFKQRISILLCEAELGFNEDWGVELERKATRLHIVNYFRELKYRCSHEEISGVPEDPRTIVSNARLDIRILQYQLSAHGVLSRFLQSFLSQTEQFSTLDNERLAAQLEAYASEAQSLNITGVP
jgi:hypothetical protein